MTGETRAGLGQADHVWFRGNYSTWGEARRASTGYDSPDILEKVRAATLKVISGEAASERDSVPVTRVEYSLPLLACLLYVASRSGNRLSVLDFGGSLGSSYWQNRSFLNHLESLRWLVVEQSHFVQVGRSEIANDVLRFYESLDECIAEAQPNAALLSSVLPYLEKPFDTFGSVLSKGLPFVILDRTPFFVGDRPDRLTVEHVHPAIYRGSYPAWFFNLQKFRAFVEDAGYGLVEEFDSWERWDVEGEPAQSKCFLFERDRV